MSAKQDLTTFTRGFILVIGSGFQSKPVAYSSRAKSLERWAKAKHLQAQNSIWNCSEKPYSIAL